MSLKRKILNYCIATVLAAVVIFAGVTTSRRAANPVCSAITIVVKDSTARQYVTPAELRLQLIQAGLWQVGEPLSKISCHKIEQNLLTHPMLRRAECYELTNGEVRIIVTQRQPVVRIAGDEHYFIDSDRKIMPVTAAVNTPVIVVSGRIGKQQALGEMYDFVVWLNCNNFWRSKIHNIRVANPKMIELVDSEHNYTIIIGSLDAAQQRLDELETLYTDGFERIGFPNYKQIDLQFNGQIIGRK